ncbi:methyltransferase [Flavobacterium aquariorum]|uniref:Methyltransferase n=1 Tax=Flavobacterium aquariorum TaxID=2217670 RepID=A0A2W7TUU5_9FLAO|nr:methyltransferase [Flavobacterium aquariorum]PZX94333.1 methyltransferase [Flavobacterium aquariorum]
MENQDYQPSPGGIMQIGSGFWTSKLLLAAVKFQLFTKLAEKESMSAQEIKTMLNLKCTDIHLFDFLDALAGLGFLNREGLLESAIYSNSTNTDAFLVINKPAYIGGMLDMLNNRLYQFWGNLEEGLLTGLPQNEIKAGDDNLFDELYKSPERLLEFINAMGSIQIGNFNAFAQSFDFSKYKTLTDVGGCGAVLSTTIAKHQPHMKCTSFDLPVVEPIAKEKIAKTSFSDRVTTASGDFFADPFPKADVIVMGNILHDWDEPKKLLLLQKAYDALPEGGTFVAIENIIDDERSKNVFGMMMSLNMLIETGTGFDYTFASFNKWTKSVGFKSTSIVPLTGPASAAIAYK